MYKNLLCFYNNELTKQKIKKTILFTIAIKSIKYIGIHLTKEVKDLYTENHKTLMKEIKKKEIRGKTTTVHGFKELTLKFSER